MKKFIGGLVGAAIIAGTIASPVKAEYKDPWDNYYPDDTWGSWAETEMLDLLQADILRGQKEFNRKQGIVYLYLNPNNTISRAEFVAMIVRALELETTKKGTAFTDTKGHWAQNDINTASALGVVSGKTATTFDPNGKISRAEISSILVRAFDPTVDFAKGTAKTFADLKSSHWAYNHVRQANQVGIVGGTSATTVSPDKNATRAEAAVMIRRALWKEEVGLPQAGALTTQVLQNEKDGMAAFNEQDFDKLAVLNDKNHYGLVHAMMGQFLGFGYEEEIPEEEMPAEGEEEFFYEEKQELISEPKLTLVSSSTRFAKVNVENFIVKYTITYYDEELKKNVTDTYEEDLSSMYHLIKRDDSWKVYSTDYLTGVLYDTYFEEEQE
ncbi:S-layer homology domain-containing protein [Fictibacillus nanhaiensis]|uniref:S-layer homology domain-containing protein n=1 Tax=Fictibacillus nanhaiensis TaxID=742169 RepID=UPI002E1A37C9|nr:S-layer homology domain-containing protein [Fictibacillus nanhaiensis]